MSEQQALLALSSRVAFAAFLPALVELFDRGKPQRRVSARLKKKQKKQVHSQYTTAQQVMKELIQHCPALNNDSSAPFSGWGKQKQDSLLQIVAHPDTTDTLLGQIFSIANHLAMGADKASFQQVTSGKAAKKHSKKGQEKKLLTLFEQINIDLPLPTSETKKSIFAYRYDLKPLSPASIFPVLAQHCEALSAADIQKEYYALWEGFCKGLKSIPYFHRQNLSLWLDHFDTLLGTYTHSIPVASQTATQAKTQQGVSLYDHAKTRAALATTLWRYHFETENKEDLIETWDKKKFLLIQGDFFGIQSFIFANGGASNKKAAKLLRGRSFYVSLLMECAALRLLDQLSLPSTSQVLNAAGKFIIIAPNTEKTITALTEVQKVFNQWFLEQSWGQSGIGLAWEAASCSDFSHEHYKDLMSRLYEKLDIAKHQRLNLCEQSADHCIFGDYLTRFEFKKGVCEVDGRSPATMQQEGICLSVLANDHINCGKFIVNQRLERLLISRNPLNNQKNLKLDLFGYFVSFSKDRESSGEFGQLAQKDQLLRVWDFSLPQEENKVLWKGYARRNINAYVPIFDQISANEKEQGKYSHCDEDEFAKGAIKNFAYLAHEDKKMDENKQWRGAEGLMTLKGDIDNLGLMFKHGLQANNFVKMATLSRQVNHFFALYLPWLCQQEPFKNTYTVFAGGDDFFLMGSWHSQMRLARRLRADFQRYVVNPQIHFSLSLTMSKPSIPITYLAEQAEKALNKAKKYNPQKYAIAPKDAVNCFQIDLSWDDFIALAQREKNLNAFKQDYGLSTGYLYGLLTLIDMRSNMNHDPTQSLWRAYFAYRTRRLVEGNKRLNETQRRAQYNALAQEISEQGIETYGEQYKVALFPHLYQQRYT